MNDRLRKAYEESKLNGLNESIINDILFEVSYLGELSETKVMDLVVDSYNSLISIIGYKDKILNAEDLFVTSINLIFYLCTDISFKTKFFYNYKTRDMLKTLLVEIINYNLLSKNILRRLIDKNLKEDNVILEKFYIYVNSRSTEFLDEYLLDIYENEEKNPIMKMKKFMGR